ncbi:hypothetical protein O3M35_002113 [Rhynocoris fuscipes]|uniref:Cytosol aminopeptidase n=1 Tax=Rhynocoris fuscipes TaxID=488301 RepID=A0AAW1CSF8_9HEMI
MANRFLSQILSSNQGSITRCIKHKMLRGKNHVENYQIVRHLNCQGDSSEMTGLVLGVFTKDDDPYGTTKIFTKVAEEYDNQHNKSISIALEAAGSLPRAGQTRVFYGLDPYYQAICVTGVGEECVGYNDVEQVDELKEAIRNAAALGARTLQEIFMRTIYIDSFENAESAAEGAAMGIWVYQEYKQLDRQMIIPRIELFNDCDFTGWQIGLQKAAAQNLARQLTEMPANMLTPINFAQAAVESVCRAGISAEVRVKEWCKIMHLDAFLAAASGSCEPPIFLELSYYGCDPDVAPVVLIGKGVTYDSGGVCLKSCDVQRYMRGDMSGGATVLSTARAVSALQLPINLRCIIPLHENMPGTCAMKPGDVIKTRNGKTVLIHDTDFDGRLALADALAYAVTYNPKFICDIGSFSKELVELLGEAATIVYCNNDILYEMMRIASIHTGDRIWRLPLWNHFSEKVLRTQFSDVQDKLHNVDSGLPCTCAAFLKEFAPPGDWIHLDTYAVLLTDGKAHEYLRPGFSGKPTRTIIEFLAQLACKHLAVGEEKMPEEK